MLAKVFPCRPLVPQTAGGLMTWPDGSKRRSDAMINGPDPLISAEYGLLYQKGHEHSGRLVNILQRWEGGRVRKKNEKKNTEVVSRRGDRAIETRV